MGKEVPRWDRRQFQTQCPLKGVLNFVVGEGIRPGSPPAAASAAAPADNPERADALTSRDGLVLDAEAQATWEKLLDRPPRDLPDIRALLDMPAPPASS